jgi:hypothetical protein
MDSFPETSAGVGEAHPARIKKHNPTTRFIGRIIAVKQKRTLKTSALIYLFSYFFRSELSRSLFDQTVARKRQHH